MEENSVEVQVCTRPKYTTKKLLRNGCVLLLAIAFACLHYKYVSLLFENDRNFSHLSELEREMSLRTEMGFYYSYYKTVVHERPFIAGISKLMYDRAVEHPKEVNAFNRFNIHPEVLVGAIYRYLEPMLNTSRDCHMVDRGSGLTPVQSCVGIGEPMYFYLEVIWGLAGLLVAVLFVHAVTLSESILGGSLAVIQYFANHSECTRVQWAPNERENFAAPLLFLQTWLLTVQLKDRDKRTSCQIQVSIFILNCLCLLFWQFTQFIFLTQIAIFFVMEQLRIIDLKTLCIFLHSHFCGLHMAVLLLHGNDMLKSSLYTSLFLTVSAYTLFFSTLRIKIRNKIDLLVEAWLVLLRISIVIISSVYLKKVISDFLEVDEDSHVWDLLYSKLSNYKTFHTLLYTCSEVFDFLPLSSIKNMFKTLLIPFVLLNCVNVVVYWLNVSINETRKYYQNFDNNFKSEKDIAKINQDDEDSGIENNAEQKATENVKEKSKMADESNKKSKMADTKEVEDIIDNYWICLLKNLNIDAAVFYNLSQMAVFAVMAGLVMRLKLLFVTQMCIVSSLILDNKYYSGRTRLLPLVWVICGSLMFQRLHDNVYKEISHIGEFSDIPQEELLKWISQAPVGAYAGSMPVSATVMLATRRPIVAHPHYEHKEARQRAYSVYKMYGRFSADELYQEMTKLKASYLIVEMKYCYGYSSSGCSFETIWDTEAPSHAGNPKLCHTLLTEPTDHFYRLYSNEQYAVFRIHDLSVRYMPRSFDT